MFKHLSTALLLVLTMGVISPASAVSLNEAGSEGQVLIFPYYNVNNNYITLFNITNTTGQTKAVKMRFRESDTSNDVLDFNVYMSPYDVFKVSLNKTDTGGVTLRTQDNTCTHPAIPREGVKFRNVYDSVSNADLREGYLEVIEMGEVSNSTIAYAVEHVDGMPRDCSAIEKAWQTGLFTQGGADSNTGSINVVNSKASGYPNLRSQPGFYGQGIVKGLNKPTGGLVGSSILVDTVKIAGFVSEPVSVQNYSTRAQHYLSSDENFYLLPSLASGNVYNTWDSVARDWGLDDKNVLPRVSVPSGINPMPLAEAMSTTYIGNQYFLGGNTSTDWVIAMPMRKHGIFNDFSYVSNGIGYVIDSDIPVHGDIGDALAPYGYWKNLDSDDVNAKFVYWNTEEAQVSPQSGDFSPPLETEETYVPFPREVNILALNSSLRVESVLGSDNVQTLTLNSGFVNGWGAFDFSKYSLNDLRYTSDWTSTTSVNLRGVPLTGFMAAISQLNSGNVGETFPHFVKR